MVLLHGPAGFHLRWKTHNAAPAWLSTREIVSIDSVYGIQPTGQHRIEIQVPEAHGFTELRLLRDDQKRSGSYEIAFQRGIRLHESLDIWTLRFAPDDFARAMTPNFSGLRREESSDNTVVNVADHSDGTTVLTLRSQKRLRPANISIPPEATAFIREQILPKPPDEWRAVFEKSQPKQLSHTTDTAHSHDERTTSAAATSTPLLRTNLR